MIAVAKRTLPLAAPARLLMPLAQLIYCEATQRIGGAPNV